MKFGIGCFHFSVDYEVGDDFDPTSYVKELRSHLEDYPTISDLSISDYRYSVGSGFGKHSERHGFIEDSRILPWPTNFRISFSICIAERFHGNYLTYRSKGSIGERFKVLVEYDSGFPVAFVFPEESATSAPPTE